VRKDDPKARRFNGEALALNKHAWRTISWREGTNRSLQSRGVRVRVAPIRGVRRRDAAHPMAHWQGCTHQVLAPQYVVSRGCRPRRAALTHRAQLLRPHAGNRPRRCCEAAAGRASSITAAHQSRPTTLRSANERGPPLESKNLSFSIVVGPAALPITAVPCPQFDRNDPSSVGCRNCNDPSCCRCCVRRPFGPGDGIYDAVVIADVSTVDCR